jgi:hypothetical protein
MGTACQVKTKEEGFLLNIDQCKSRTIPYVYVLFLMGNLIPFSHWKPWRFEQGQGRLAQPGKHRLVSRRLLTQPNPA